MMSASNQRNLESALRAAAVSLRTELQDIRDKIDLVRSTRPHPHYSHGFRLPRARWGAHDSLLARLPDLYEEIERAYRAAQRVNDALVMRETRTPGKTLGVIDEDGLDPAYDAAGHTLKVLDRFLAMARERAAPYAGSVATVDLLPEQEELLVLLVEAERNLRPDRRDFRLTSLGRRDGPRVFHGGLPGNGQALAPLADFQELLAAKLLRKVREDGRGDAAQWYLALTLAGFQAYEAIKQREGGTIERVETEIQRYLDHEIQERYPRAFAALQSADALLWGSDPAMTATKVGHDCREAMQAFADEILARFPADVDPGAGPTPKLRAVLQAADDRLGSTERDALEALVRWWSSLYDLANRQEHGARREGLALVFEDSRRLVFLSTVVMTEVDRSLAR